MSYRPYPSSKKSISYSSRRSELYKPPIVRGYGTRSPFQTGSGSIPTVNVSTAVVDIVAGSNISVVNNVNPSGNTVSVISAIVPTVPIVYALSFQNLSPLQWNGPGTVTISGSSTLSIVFSGITLSSSSVISITAYNAAYFSAGFAQALVTSIGSSSFTMLCVNGSGGSVAVGTNTVMCLIYP